MPKPTKETYTLKIDDTVFTAVHIHSKAHKLDLVIFTAVDGELRPVDRIDLFCTEPAVNWRVGLHAASHNDGYDRVVQFPHTGAVAIQGWSGKRGSWDASVSVVMSNTDEFIRNVDIMEPLRLHEARRLVDVRRRLGRGERIVLSEGD